MPELVLNPQVHKLFCSVCNLIERLGFTIKVKSGQSENILKCQKIQFHYILRCVYAGVKVV